jgi:hypothetical protein
MSLALVLPVALAGCGSGGAEKANAPKTGVKPADQAGDNDEVKANLAQLALEDRQLAEAQKFCVVESENRLGSMGTPVKVMVEGQPVFVCCKSCQKKALADPQKTLAKVKELKESGPAPLK